MQQTMRRSMIVTFWAFLLFALAYVALGRITDPRAPFDAVAQAHQEVNAAFTVLAYGGYIVLLIVLLGGLPVLFTALKRAFVCRPLGVLALFRLRAKWLLRLLGSALLCAALLLGTILGTELLFGGPPAPGSQQMVVPATPLGFLLAGLVLIGGTTLVIFVLLVIAAALSAVVARSEFGPKLLTFALATIIAITLGMGMTAAATVVWVVRFWMDAPGVALSNADLGSVGLAWVVVVSAAMVVATVAGLLASWWGWRARGQRVIVA